jgi:hypothetical protein
MSKKLVLPKFYLRSFNIENDMEDELSMEEPIIFPEVPKVPEVIQQEDKMTSAETPPIKKRALTQYNIFMKETMALLASTRPELIGKERFKYAVHLWNEKKKMNSS